MDSSSIGSQEAITSSLTPTDGLSLSLSRKIPRLSPLEHSAKWRRSPVGRYEDLLDFVKCYNPRNRHRRKATWDEDDAPEGRWCSYSYDELMARDKTSLDIFWLKDKSLTDLDNLPEPDELVEEIIENLEAGLHSFRQVLAGLES